MTTIFEITVYGVVNHSALEQYRVLGIKNHWTSYKFKILQSVIADTYEVICRMGIRKLSCGIYSTKKEAHRIINAAMKIAMKGKLLYQYCLNCGNKNFYSTECVKCRITLQPWGWLLNKSILIDSTSVRIAPRLPASKKYLSEHKVKCL